jgi:hypothetical protein
LPTQDKLDHVLPGSQPRTDTDDKVVETAAALLRAMKGEPVPPRIEELARQLQEALELHLRTKRK